MSLGGRSALVEGPATAPSIHNPRLVAHGIAVEEGPVTSLPPRKLKAVSPGKVEDGKITGTYRMQLPAEPGAPAQWLQMLIVEGLSAPPATFFGIEGATEATWKSPIPSPARELISCVGFDGLAAIVEVHGDKEARFVVGGRYLGATTSTDVTGAFVVDGDVYLWLTREGRAELIDLAAGVARRAPDAPRRLEGMPGTPRCPMR